MNKEQHYCPACSDVPVPVYGDLCPNCEDVLEIVTTKRHVVERLIQMRGGWPTQTKRLFTMRYRGQHFIRPICRSEDALADHSQTLAWAPIEAVLHWGDSEPRARRQAIPFRHAMLPCTLEWNTDMSRDLKKQSPLVSANEGKTYWPDHFIAFDYIVDAGEDGHVTMERRGSMCLLRSEIKAILLAARDIDAEPFPAPRPCLSLADMNLVLPGMAHLKELESAFFPLREVRAAYRMLLDPNSVIVP